jgi:WD40 repeat protein
LDSGKFIAGPHTVTGRLTRIEFSPDSARLALVDINGPVTILDGRSGQVISSTIKHTANLAWVEWAPDSRRLLTAGWNSEALVWDTDTGEQLLGPLRMPDGDILVARWSPDGRSMITRSDKQQVRVWDATTGEAVTPLLKHSGDVGFMFMTHSNRLITASQPDLLRAWDLNETALPRDVLADYAKLVSGRRLDAAGVMLHLKPNELAELSRSLRVRAPELFE